MTLNSGVPVVVVQHDAPEGAPIFAKGSENWKLHAVVADRPADHHIGKSMASVFAGTDLAEWLAKREIDALAVTGFMTHNRDAATIYHAPHAGLKVEFLSDATGALPYENAAGKVGAEEIHRVFSTVFHSSFAASVSTDEWIAATREARVLERDNIYLSNKRARAGRYFGSKPAGSKPHPGCSCWLRARIKTSSTSQWSYAYVPYRQWRIRPDGSIRKSAGRPSADSPLRGKPAPNCHIPFAAAAHARG